MATKRPRAYTLRDAVYANHVGDVRDLVATATQQQRNSALQAAGIGSRGESSSLEIVRILLAAGADPNCAVLQSAKFQFNVTVQRLVLEAGADPNCRSALKQTPLHLAISCVKPHDPAAWYAAPDIERARRALEMVQTLLSWRADAAARDDRGDTALDVLDVSCREHPGDDPVVQAIAVMLLKAGSPSPADPSPLVRAAMDAVAAEQRFAARAPAGPGRRLA